MEKNRSNIKTFSPGELEQLLKESGEPRFRARQLHRWLYSDRVGSFEEMTTLSARLRDKLAQHHTLPSCSIASVNSEPTSAAAGATRKYLVRLHDGKAVESVLIPKTDPLTGKGIRSTVCVSVQVGCALDCTFCATAKMGFSRNLTAAEMAEQVYLLADLGAEDPDIPPVTNVVFMGMGEPLQNLDEVMEATQLLSMEGYRFSISQRRITISTVGITPGIRKLAESGLTCKLAVSLHHTRQEQRAAMMPVATTYPLDELREAMHFYSKTAGTPITIVYMLIKGINDDVEDARRLARYCRGFYCKINLIDYNAIINIKFESSEETRRQLFIKTIVDAGYSVTVRRSQGASIDAACGQLALRNNKG
ncbi:23S rRNA (adenine(2503)-C(2))-methyltransferase RlmN [Prosthecochloris sp. CIB 2401]|uniref:23S rRNA (adenine(2503)-C(2))-methyltransferase RlmN n=1 Tax=Prosthecochloris sp. CIB 2401 TaxID=1868325 RepID=UPI00080AAE8E|nr:23S rRNA (adenine(2503)-C(2))-methyltransferase RlmN [Prosthecochloris sp. CIB 2401]ANT64970.1 putative dual-specificity RNA methyltransferase RlmN [Prosthecochloris sp. CIB 2401]